MDTTTIKRVNDELTKMHDYGSKLPLYKTDEGVEWIINGIKKTIDLLDSDPKKIKYNKIRQNLVEIRDYGRNHKLYTINSGVSYIVNALDLPITIITDAMGGVETPKGDYDMPKKATPPLGDDGKFYVPKEPKPEKSEPDEGE